MQGPNGTYAWTVTVGEKGQIVIPKQAREVFGISPGDTLVLLGDITRGLAIPPSSAFDQFAAAIFDAETSSKSPPKRTQSASTVSENAANFTAEEG